MIRKGHHKIIKGLEINNSNNWYIKDKIIWMWMIYLLKIDKEIQVLTLRIWNN